MAKLALSRAVATDARHWLALVRAAEQRGLASAASADLASADAFVDAAAAAVVTTHLPLSILVALPTRSPLQTALAAAGVATLAGPARLTLGLAAGSEPVNEGGHGVPFAPPLARLREFARTVLAILRAPAGEPVQWEGTYFRARGWGQGLDAAALPLVIGAHGPRMVRLAAEIADGLAMHLLTPRRVLRQRVALARALRPTGFPISAGIFAAVDDDLSRALAAARLEVTAALLFPRFLGRLAELTDAAFAERFAALGREGRVREAAALLDDELVREFALVCRPGELVAEAAALEMVEVVSPVPVGQFALTVPAFGVTRADVRAQQHRLAAALVGA
ncbi:MAG: LLM class flavin-dependent oxidoreductase [Chloroflexi bacterium]|nr:LLM class flavin-dependent oxidoreductase [Chloroflexota bacterium]